MPQFCGGTAAWRMKVEGGQGPILGALETKRLKVVESSVSEHYYGDRIAFRYYMVFITSQIFEVSLGGLFAPAYLPYCNGKYTVIVTASSTLSNSLLGHKGLRSKLSSVSWLWILEQWQ